MQDIQLLKPDQVKIGREQHDICIRLKDEIGKARKEYERRLNLYLVMSSIILSWDGGSARKGDP